MRNDSFLILRIVFSFDGVLCMGDPMGFCSSDREAVSADQQEQDISASVLGPRSRGQCCGVFEQGCPFGGVERLSDPEDDTVVSMTGEP